MSDQNDQQRLEIASRLKEAREYLGLSQDEVAGVLGLARTAITNIESGQRKVEAVELDRLAKLYGQTVDFLLSGVRPAADADDRVQFYARTFKGLSDGDLKEVGRFAQFLRTQAGNRRRK